MLDAAQSALDNSGTVHFLFKYTVLEADLEVYLISAISE
ncbi:hypothetical protein MP213Fo_05330 [Pseudochrobactrum sp. MP213Fo]